MVRRTLALFSVLRLAYWASGAKQSPFLKEILTGRCYFQPPGGIAGSCPSVVGNIMGVLEGSLDDDIDADSFSAYFDSADFTPGEKGGMFWLKGERNENDAVIPKGWTTPETTPGGAMMNGLTFCGVDLHQDCPEVSGASTAFWTSAYAKYATDLQGGILLVLGKRPNLTHLLDGVIPNLDPEAVTSVTIYSEDCYSEDVELVTSIFFDAKVDLETISCAEDLITLMVCQEHESTACQCLTGEDKPQPTPEPSKSSERVYKVLFWILLATFLAGAYTTRKQIFNDYRNVGSERILLVQSSRQAMSSQSNI
jgi:hypothetical protein